MGAFNSHIGPVGRLLAARSPESNVGVLQNRRLCAELEPLFESHAHKLAHPDEYLRELAVELTSPFVISSDEKHGHQFGALWLNRQALGGTLLRISGFQENNTELDAQMRAYYLAQTNPDTQILIVDTLAHGLSDDYTAEQRRGMFTIGDLSGVGAEMARSISRQLSENHMPLPHSGSAMSYGSRMLVEVARQGAEEGLKFDRLVNFELPGTVPARVRTHTSYFLYEWMQDRIRFGTEWLEGFKTDFSQYLDSSGNADRPRDLPNFLSRDKRAVFQNFWNSVLGMPTGLESMLEVIGSGTDIVRVNGDSSRTTRASDALLQHQLGGQTLYLMGHMPHGGIGHVVTAPVMASLDRELRTIPQDHGVYEISPFDYIPSYT